MVSFSLSNKIQQSKIDLLKSQIMAKAAELNADVDKFLNYESVPFDCFPMISSDLRESNGELANESFIPKNPAPRFYCNYTIWKSVDREQFPEHWASDVCTSNSKYYAMFMHEYYGKIIDNYHNKNSLKNYFDSSNVKYGVKDLGNDDSTALGLVTRHDILLKVDGVGCIMYTVINEDLLKISAPHFVRTRNLSEPYCRGLSVHEFFRLMLEWQWAYQNLESREIMAEVANEFLLALGLNVFNSSDPVIKSLLDLPDQQLAQYIKTGTCQINEEEPECPLEFYNWTKEIMNLINLSYQYKKLLSRSTV